MPAGPKGSCVQPVQGWGMAPHFVGGGENTEQVSPQGSMASSLTWTVESIFPDFRCPIRAGVGGVSDNTVTG